MAKFTVRVELHDASPEDYETLHEKMEEYDFIRTIKDKSGKEYHLPRAEYNYTSSKSKKAIEVSDLAKIPVREMIRESYNTKLSTKELDDLYMLFITKSDGRSWHNLEPVAKD